MVVKIYNFADITGSTHKELGVGEIIDNVLLNELEGIIVISSGNFSEAIETEIKAYAKKQAFNILYDKCPCAFGTYRVDTREWMKEIPNKQKKAIVKNFQTIIPELRKKETTTKHYTCETCKEPARTNLCNACKIFAEL